MNLLAGLERQSTDELAVAGDAGAVQLSLHKRFGTYRLLVRLTTLSATIGLALWLASSRGPSV